MSDSVTSHSAGTASLAAGSKAPTCIVRGEVNDETGTGGGGVGSASLGLISGSGGGLTSGIVMGCDVSSLTMRSREFALNGTGRNGVGSSEKDGARGRRLIGCPSAPVDGGVTEDEGIFVNDGGSIIWWAKCGGDETCLLGESSC